jgi:hypothetical protein
MNFLKPHHDTEGPFGLPMKETQAQALEAIIKTLPQSAEPRFIVSDNAPSELLLGEWLLLEYACVYIPCQKNAVVEAVSELPVMPFTPEAEILKSIDHQIAAIDFHHLARQAVEDGIDRARGRI